MIVAALLSAAFACLRNLVLTLADFLLQNTSMP
jgi:hypothetical protein